MEALIGKAPLTVVRMDDGRRVSVSRGALVPHGFDESDAERLYDEGYLDVVEIPDPEGSEPEATPVVDEGAPAGATGTPADPGTTPPGPAPADVATILKGAVDEVLDAVGDNADLAVEVLAAEQARSRPRTGVVEGLQEAIAAAAGEQ